MPDFMTDWWFLGLMAMLLLALVIVVPIAVVLFVVLRKPKDN
jgi:hypothetical protein